MPRSQKPSDAPPAPAAKKSVSTKAGAAKTAGGSGVNKKASRSVAATADAGPPGPSRGAGRKASAASAPKAAAHPPGQVEAGPAGGEEDRPRAEFLAEQRQLLLEERASYTRQAEELKAEADSLALEHEPGDVQFDEEGGEGGTSNVDRELDLVLSAQARAAITEIDRALAKIGAGTYGVCEQCGQDIPQARLKALPYAALCVGCKSGGLSRRS
jgi:DnaK suppressor protein